MNRMRPIAFGIGVRERRRVLLVAVAALFVPSAHAGEAPPMPSGGRPWRIGWLSGLDRAGAQPYIEIFAAAMREKGWVLGQHYVIELRASGGDARRYPALAAELVALAPDVLLSVETSALALRQHTTTIPIVLMASVDPVAAGLVRSLAHPGTNVTGMAGEADALMAKHMEALFEIVPRARRVVLLYDPNWSGASHSLKVAREIAQAKGAELEGQPITTDAESVRMALASFEHRRPDGLVIRNTGATNVQASAILAEVRRLRLPAVGLIEAGGLVRYDTNIPATVRESADFVDRIFRGAKPADLPARQLMSVVVVVNARLAREIGVELPAAVRVRADKTID